MMHPLWQPWVALPLPQRAFSVSAWVSPLILVAPSNRPVEKLRVG
jgi:hypothetical protein